MRLLGLAFTLAVLALGDDTAGKFKLIQTTLVLPPAANSQTFTVLIKGAGLKIDAKHPATPALADANTPASPSVQVTTKFLSSSNPAAGDQLLKFEVKVEKFPPAESQSRVFTISFADVHEALPYTLTNLNGKTFAWSVKAPPEWNLGFMSALPIAFHTGDLPATGISLYQADLTSDDKQKITLGKQDFELCANAPPAACQPPDPILAVRSPFTLYLRPAHALPYGTLKGNIAIFANEKTDPDVFALTLYSPNPYGIPLGFACLLLGVLLAVFVQFGLRVLSRGLEERRLVLIMKERLLRLQNEFSRLPANIKTAAVFWKTSADRLDQSLTQLKKEARPMVPQPLQSDLTDLQGFKAKMEELGATFSFLRTLLQSGLEVVADWQRNHPGHDAKMQDAAQSIATISQAPDVSADIKAILLDLRTKAAVTSMLVTLAAAPRTIAEELHAVSFQIMAVNIVAILFWAAVSVLSGALLFIFQSPAFGTNLDLMLCVAWGLGISTAGGTSPQTTPSTVASSIGIKLPGAGDPAK
jgi:hypothetical protein